MRPTTSPIGVLFTLLLGACASDTGQNAPQEPSGVPIPGYAAGWQTIRSEDWQLELRLPPDVGYVTGVQSALCEENADSTVVEPAGADSARDAVGLYISFAPAVFGNGEPGSFGWRRPTDWNPDAYPGWDVYGEGPSSAELVEGNGWFGVGGEPLVKIFLDEDECIGMMGLDSAAADSAIAAARADSSEITCGSVHDNRPRYMAVVRRPSDGCYLMLQRTDGIAVGEIAETIRFIENGRLVAPVGMHAPRAFSYPTHAGVAMRTGPSTGCLMLRDPQVAAGTPLTMISLALEDEQPRFSFVGEPEPAGCGLAPAGHSDASDSTRWYAYHIGSGEHGNEHHAYDASDQPVIALLGHLLEREQLDSLRSARDSMRLRDPTDARAIRLLIDADRDGVAEAFAEENRGDSIIFTITRGSAAGAPVAWRTALPRSPAIRSLPSAATAVSGRVERNRYGEVCLTIANPRVPYLTAVEITAPGAAKPVQAHVAWRPPGGCSASQQAGERGYGLMLVDTGALAVGAMATGRIR